MADDDKLLQISRIQHFDGNEEYMVERENQTMSNLIERQIISQMASLYIMFCMPRAVVNMDTGEAHLEYRWTNKEAESTYLQLQEHSIRNNPSIIFSPP